MPAQLVHDFGAIVGVSCSRQHPRDRGVIVRPRNAAVGAFALVALLVGALYAVKPVPDWAVAAVGGPSALARAGGITLTWRPPAGYDASELQRRFERRGANVVVRTRGDVVELDLPGVDADTGPRAARMLAHGGQFELHDVIEGDHTLAGIAGTTVDHWVDEQGVSHHHRMLEGRDRAALEAALAGYAPPRGTEVMIEHLHDGTYRAYEVASEALLHGDPIENAEVSVDPNTNRPVVLVEFTPEAGREFGDVTERLVGHKLANLIGGEIVMAPVVNSPIHGGRASISLGGGNMAASEHEARALVAALRAGTLPAGGEITDTRYTPPADASTAEWLARFALGIGAGLIVGVVMGVLVAIARPVRWVRARRAGRAPIGRLALTIVVPALVLAIGWLNTWVPGAEDEDTFVLGLTPIVIACVVVDIVAVLAPRWRALRHGGASGRRVFGLPIAVGSFALAAVIGYTLVGKYRAPALDRAAGIACYVGATAMLAWIAALVGTRGLGSGYGAIWIAGLALHVFVDSDEVTNGQLAFAAIAVVTIGGGLAALARWRIARAGQHAMAVPVASGMPLAFATVVAMGLVKRRGCTRTCSTGSRSTCSRRPGGWRSRRWRPAPWWRWRRCRGGTRRWPGARGSRRRARARGGSRWRCRGCRSP